MNRNQWNTLKKGDYVVCILDGEPSDRCKKGSILKITHNGDEIGSYIGEIINGPANLKSNTWFLCSCASYEMAANYIVYKKLQKLFK